MLLSPQPFSIRSAIRPRNLPPSSSRLHRGYNKAPRGALGALHVPAVGGLDRGLLALVREVAAEAARVDRTTFHSPRTMITIVALIRRGCTRVVPFDSITQWT